MGHIYKITNLVNNKVYIGQTIKTVSKRFLQHKNNSNKSYFSLIVLYKAMNKYGVENFICEEIEEVPNKQLDEREKYWIKYYDSYNNGYNSTCGGRATLLYDWDEQDIIDKYYQLKSARKVATELGCDHSTIDRILNAHNVPRFTISQLLSRPVILIDTRDNKEYYFDSTLDTAKWLMEKRYTKMTNLTIVRQEVGAHIRNNKKYLLCILKYAEE